jgi:multiple sugar transport system ATP-binding protein
MDEPLSNLDTQLRVAMRAELTRLHHRLGVTTVYVTHDQVEAMTLGNRSAVMRDGRVQQVGTPQVLYRDPVNLFVAAFIGSPGMNLVRAELDGEHVRFGGLRLPLDQSRRPARDVRGSVILGIRPEDFEDAEFSPQSLPTIDVEVAIVEDLGPELLAFFAVDAERVESNKLGLSSASDQTSLIGDDRRALFGARLNPATPARAGGTMKLSVNTSHFHFFSPFTGDRLPLEAAEAVAAGAAA